MLIYLRNFLHLTDYLIQLCHVKILNVIKLRWLKQTALRNVMQKICLMLRCLRKILLK